MLSFLEIMASDYRGQAWHDVQIHALHRAGKKKKHNECHHSFVAQSVSAEGLSDFWKCERDFIFFFSLGRLIHALNWFSAPPVSSLSRGGSGLADHGQLVLISAAHRSSVKWGCLTPAGRLAPDHLFAGGCSICYPFGALMSVSLTLKDHFAVLIKFQVQDRL